jgi:hypothetical protein
MDQGPGKKEGRLLKRIPAAALDDCLLCNNSVADADFHSNLWKSQ